MIYLAQLERIINECKKHVLRLEEAASDMQLFVPLDSMSLGSLSKEQVRIVDQLLFRFSKLQDAIGNKLFKAILLALGEDIDDKPMIDILNRLEKLNLFSDIEGWFQLRQLRNELSHEYEDDSEELSQLINKIYEVRAKLISYFIPIEEYYSREINEGQ